LENVPKKRSQNIFDSDEMVESPNNQRYLSKGLLKVQGGGGHQANNVKEHQNPFAESYKNPSLEENPHDLLNNLNNRFS
jgi:hypothetical protein